MARCDRCGEGAQDWQRSQVDAEKAWEVVKAALDELKDACAVCWVTVSADTDAYMHSFMRCQREKDLTQRACDEFRQLVQYEVRSHSCTKCGVSQKFCATGREDGRACQWLNVVVLIVRAVMGCNEGVELIRGVGYKGEYQD